MFATESLWSIFNIIPELLGGAIMMGIGTLWGRWKSIQVWRTKKFEDRVVLGLNTLHREGDKQKLLLRTIFETDLYELLQDKTMVKIVKAIKASTEDNPLLIFPEMSLVCSECNFKSNYQSLYPRYIEKDMGILLLLNCILSVSHLKKKVASECKKFVFFLFKRIYLKISQTIMILF